VIDRFWEAALIHGSPLLIRRRPECASAVSCCRQDVQGHFGADVLERSHLEVGGSHPGLYRTEGVLHGLAAFAHLNRVSIEARLYSLKDRSVLA
jgi:hypothetical protein